ncbi:hypothetical protein AFP16_13005 [Staphylococcus aureus]|nr:hypothetical protein SAGV69_04231 [Staphylococcus aureus]EFB98137.1 conserved hypothetical protein [Staphylococcus aureus A9765]KAJ46489.1 hypothetical protein HMPREF1625_02194 [Staphylococcus aureus 880]OZW60488.1 hypothetical protein AFP16_13005 [Staphylococcus aureus]
MTERKCACNKLFSILVRGPNKEKLDSQFLQTMQVGVWAPTQRISKRNSTGKASWGGTTK